MTSRLSLKEMEELAGRYSWLSPGESVRHNHNTEYCSGSSRSMLLKYGESNGIINASCYRCGRSGFYVVTPFPRIEKAKGKGTQSNGNKCFTNTGVVLPRGCVTDLSEWSPRARVWVGRAGITREELKEYGLMYNPHNSKVVIPSFYGGNLVGYQERGLEEGDIKYITTTCDAAHMIFRSKNTVVNGGSKAVVVEDALSAIKVGRHYPTYALQGVNVTDGLIAALRGYKQYYIWLDNDNKNVKLRQLDIANRLSVFGDTSILKTEKDPKEHSDSEILEKINGD